LDYAKVAKQVSKWSFRFDGAEKSFAFLEQVEWSAKTYGLDLDMIPRAIKMVHRQQQAMKNLGRVHRKLPHLFSAERLLTRLVDQVRQRKQGFSESFKDYIIDMQTMVRPLSYPTK